MAYCPECAASLPSGARSCPTCGARLLDTPTLVDEPGAERTLDAARLSEDLGAALLPRYELLRQLGEGGMGLVFLAREPALKRLVAVKLLAPDLASDAAARSRFEREARAAAALSHPNVVRVYAVGETGGLKLPYIIMQYVEGATLAQLMEERGRIGEREARRVIGEVAAALAAAHGRDVVHRDVKPSNVLIEKDSGRAYVADFGVSAALSPSARAGQTKLTATGMMIGTPVYMSPEQASAGDVGSASDVYSLGVLGYELLTGEPPFNATTPMGWAAAHLRDTPTPVAKRRTDVAPEVALLVDRCLAKEPRARPAAAEVARGMLPSLETELPWPPPGLHPLVGRATLLTRLALLATGAIVAVVGLLAFTPGRLFARGRWLEAFRGLAQSDNPFAEVDRMVSRQVDATLFGWQAGLVLATLVGIVALLAFLSALQRTIGVALKCRRAGWRWSTLVDVAADGDGRGGLILAGAREFAPLSAATRADILKSRRLALLALTFAALWIATVPVIRVAVAPLVGWSGVGLAPLVGGWTVVLAVGPTLAALLVAAGARWSERALLGPLARRRVYVPDPAEVAAWYAVASPGTAPRPSSAAQTVVRRATTDAAATAFSLVALAALGLGAAAAVVAARNTRSIAPKVAVLVTAAQRYADRDPQRHVAALVRPSMPALRPASDSEAGALIGSLAWRSELPQYQDFEPWQRMVRAQFPAAGGSGTGDLFRRAYAGRLGRDTVAAMAAIAAHPRTAAFRRLAHIEGLNLVRAIAGGRFDTMSSVDDLPFLTWSFSESAEANVLASLADVARRDLAAAEARLGENARVAHLLANSTLPWAAWAQRIVERFVFRPMAEIEMLRGREARAESLRAVASERIAFPGDMRVAQQFVDVAPAAGLAADMRDVAALRGMAQDTRFPVSTRFEAVRQAWYGFCLNPSEVAFGASRMRRDTLAALMASMSDVADASALGALLARGWERSDHTRPFAGIAARWRTCALYFRWL